LGPVWTLYTSFLWHPYFYFLSSDIAPGMPIEWAYCIKFCIAYAFYKVGCIIQGFSSHSEGMNIRVYGWTIRDWRKCFLWEWRLILCNLYYYEPQSQYCLLFDDILCARRILLPFETLPKYFLHILTLRNRGVEIVMTYCIATLRKTACVLGFFSNFWQNENQNENESGRTH